MDLVRLDPAALAPGPELNDILVFKDPAFPPNSAARVTYLAQDAYLYADIDANTDLSPRALFKWDGWRVINWHADPSLVNGSLAGTSTSRLVLTAQGSDSVVTPESLPRKPASQVACTPRFVRLRANSRELAKEHWGEEFFWNKAGGSVLDRRDATKQTLYLAAQYPDTQLSAFSDLTLRFTARLMSEDVQRVDLYKTNPPARNAETCTALYNPRYHGANFRIHVCSPRYRGPNADPDRADYIFVTMHLYDESNEFLLDEDSPKWFADPGSGHMIYRMDLRSFMPAAATVNPYKHVSNRMTIIERNILPEIQGAILEAADLGYLPARNDEDDATYLSHYWIGGSGVGFEITGLADLTFDIREFALVGEDGASPEDQLPG